MPVYLSTQKFQQKLGSTGQYSHTQLTPACAFKEAREIRIGATRFVADMYLATHPACPWKKPRHTPGGRHQPHSCRLSCTAQYPCHPAASASRTSTRGPQQEHIVSRLCRHAGTMHVACYVVQHVLSPPSCRLGQARCHGHAC